MFYTHGPLAGAFRQVPIRARAPSTSTCGSRPCPNTRQWETVLHTARFVLDRAPLSPLQLGLEGELHKLEIMLSYLGKSGGH